MAIIQTPEPPPKQKHNKHKESDIQRACVKWFKEAYPEYEGLLFAVPNEREGAGETALQSKIKGNRRRQMGVVAGVSDTILLVARGGLNGLCAECKTPIGNQKPEQKAWQKKVELQGYGYFVFRSVDDFKEKINGYLK